MRKNWIDNLRSCLVLCVVIYHVFYLFNAEGIPGGIGSFSPVQPQDAILYFVYPWFMVLLFMISGICAFWSLQKKSLKQFIKDRTVKLLIPSTIGLFVFQWIVGYLNLKIGGGLEYIPGFLVYFISVLSGIGPLWFIQMLWLFDLFLALLMKFTPIVKEQKKMENLPFWLLLVLVLGVWAFSQIGNMPLLTMYRFGIYGFAFFCGVLIFSSKKNLEKLSKAAGFLLAVFLIFQVVYVIVYFPQNYIEPSILQSPLTAFSAWTGSLALLGSFQRWLNFTNPVLKKLSSYGWGIYILHYACELSAGYFLYNCTALSPFWIYLIVLICGIAGSIFLYSVIRKIPWINTAVLGIRRRKHDTKSSDLSA